MLWAGSARAFSISPLKYVITIAPQSSETVEIKIVNDRATSQSFNLTILDATQNSRGKLVFDDSINSAKDWVKPEQNIVKIGPNEEKVVKFTIKIPRTAEAGSYFLGLAAENLKSGEIRTVGVSGQLICLLLLQVSGQVAESLEVIQWQREKITINKNWIFDLSVKNNGKVELPIQSKLIIKNWRDKVVYEEAANLGLLLPQADRIFHNEIKPAEGKFLFSGPYEAILQLTYGRTGQVKILTTSFWRLSPVGLIILGLLAIVMLALLLKIRTKLMVKLKAYITE